LELFNEDSEIYRAKAQSSQGVGVFPDLAQAVLRRARVTFSDF
jgi:hypothetical protein